MARRIGFSVLLTFAMLITLLGPLTPQAVQAAGPGVVLLWGKNEQGQVGDGTELDRFLPTKPIVVPASVVQIAAATAGNHALMLLADGTVLSVGENQVANLGRGPGQIGGHRVVPDFVVSPSGTGKLSNIKSIGKNTGGGHSMAVGNDGKVYIWGDNSTGQQGQGEGQIGGAPNPVPITVKTRVGPNLVDLTGIKTVVGGGGYSLALTDDGRIYSWGINFSGPLGQGNGADPIIPVARLVKNEDGTGVLGAVPGQPTVAAIAAGGQHSIALMSDGTLRAWGFNQYGQLGDGFGAGGSCCASLTLPVKVAGVDGLKFTDIAGGDNHTLLLQDNGQVWALGRNIEGQLGQGDATGGPHPIPLKVKDPSGNGTLTGVVAVSAGGSNSSMALKADGTVLAWGQNSNGQLGIGSGDGRAHTLPVQVQNLLGVQQISMSVAHSAVLASGYTLAVAGVGVSFGTTAPGSGTVTPGTSLLAAGGVASLTAKPDGNALFAGWVVDGVNKGWANPLTITLDGPHAVQASFASLKTFADVTSDRADYAAILALATRGYILGYNSASFGPDDAVQRAQMAALIARATPAGPGTPPLTLGPPACLVVGSWDCEDWGTSFTNEGPLDPNLVRDVGTLQHYGVAAGYTAADCAARGLAYPCFGMTDPVTYAQTISFITRAMKAKGYWLDQSTTPTPYTGVPATHAGDFATFYFYTGAIPASPADWSSYAPRGWFARALWQALNSYWGVDGTLPDGRPAGGYVP